MRNLAIILFSCFVFCCSNSVMDDPDPVSVRTVDGSFDIDGETEPMEDIATIGYAVDCRCEGFGASGCIRAEMFELRGIDIDSEYLYSYDSEKPFGSGFINDACIEGCGFPTNEDNILIVPPWRLLRYKGETATCDFYE
jgi:hypothetical protein